MVEVIGAGAGRTGTMSLHRALPALGFGPCFHMKDVLGEPEATAGWTRALRGDREALRAVVLRYRSTVDFPGCLLWRELAELFPRAKILLSVREPESWYRSAAATIFDPRMAELTAKLGPGTGELMAAMAERGFGPMDRAEAIDWFVRHNERVRAEAPPGRLLVYQVSEGWEPLCDFLGVDVPDEPFPRANDAADFTEQVEGFLSS